MGWPDPLSSQLLPYQPMGDGASLRQWVDLDSLTSVPVAPKKATGVLDVGVEPPHVVESEESDPSMWREAFPQRLVGMKKTVPEGARAFL